MLSLCLAQDDEEQLVQYCNKKSLLIGNTLTYTGTDWVRAYNDVASCATLRTENNENVLLLYEDKARKLTI